MPNFFSMVFLHQVLQEGAPSTWCHRGAPPSLVLEPWVDKNSVQCMYNARLVHFWSISHLRVCCWYIECGKNFCPVEEEDAKKACDQVDVIAPYEGEVQEDEVDVDISLLPEKEKNKILNQSTRDKERAKAKANREGQKAKDKAVKDVEKQLW